MGSSSESPPSLFHESLNANLFGVRRDGGVWQFRGLQYASIPYRFASPQLTTVKKGDVDCTSYGACCPQNYVDFRHLLRIPEDQYVPELRQDEFTCLNLDVTMPEPSSMPGIKGRLPVLFWIHGGSQAVTFGNSASRLCDPSSLLSRSISLKKPIIVVTVNYRLNIFAFGDETSDINLALKDQRVALEYVRLHIAGFGGDPANITIAGESAGAIYSHAHVVMGAPVRQCILQSGTMYLSPPQPPVATSALGQGLRLALSSLGGYNLRTAPVAHLLEAQAKMGLVSYYIQMEEKLEGWQQKWGDVERIAIGDNEYESAIWKSGIEALEPSIICNAFDLAGPNEKATLLKRVYGIVPGRAVSCKLGALDFLNDVRFTLPTRLVVEQSHRAQRPVFGFLIDQPNPWQSSSRAHHGVDLLYLFQSFEFPDQSAWKVAEDMQRKWIEFLSGEDPWQEGRFYAFGPLGKSEVVNVADRRRYRHLDVVLEAGLENIEAAFRAIAAGRSSLLN